jgi:signal transduction histidine kinase
MRLWLRLVLLTAGCLALGLGMTVLLLSLWQHAPSDHAITTLRYLLVSGLLSLGAGVLALLLAIRFAPTLGIKVAAASLCGSVAATINVMVTPLLMFSEQSDKDILVITLLFFFALSLAFASIVAVITTRQIHSLHTAALRLGTGDFSARVPVQGFDEVADLARAFNRMSGELGASFERERQLEQGRRDLVAAVSHDLRTPLASIRAMIEAINDGVVSNQAEVRIYLSRIQQESEHLGQLIDDLFELARIESGNFELRLSSVPLAELVTETVDGLQIHAQARNVDLHATIQETLPPLALDGPRIQRVLVNLIENALQHTPPGGEIDVSVTRTDGKVELHVADTGEGIPPEHQPRVFDRFYRGDKSRTRGADGAHAGLGLAIARGIVEAHRGSITVASETGQGTRFVIQLPVAS